MTQVIELGENDTLFVVLPSGKRFRIVSRATLSQVQSEIQDGEGHATPVWSTLCEHRLRGDSWKRVH